NAAAGDQQRVADPGLGGTSMDRFRRLSPPAFRGENNPEIAEYWIGEVEKIFRSIRCPEEDKVSVAAFTLQDRANVWWNSALRTTFRGRMVITWEEFLMAFREKYFPRHVRDKKEKEFLNLEQGAMSVMDYEAKFSELEKYAPHICADEGRRT